MAQSSKKTPAKKIKKTKTLDFSQLRKINFLVSFLLAAQGILIIVLSNSQNALQPITTNFLAKDKVATEASGHSVYASASQLLFDLNIAYVVAAFLFIGAIAHLLIASWRKKVYESDLKKDVNRARWIEYSLSASTMMVAIALLTGVYDLVSLIMIFTLTGIMSLMGLTMELRNQNTPRTDWANYWVGVASGLIPWLVFLIYSWSAHVYGNGMPAYVYFIYGSLFILFGSIAVNLYLQYKKQGHWASYLFGERMYIILSFVAKSVLAWQIFAGILK